MPTLQTVREESTAIVPFAGTELYLVKDGETLYTAMKSIVQGIGLDWGAQQQKLNNQSDKFNCRAIPIVASDGCKRPMLCIPLKKLNGWLFSINPQRCRPDIRPGIVKYQEECFEVLHDHFHRRTENKRISHPQLPANSLLGGIIEYKKVRVIPNVALSALFRCSGSTLRNHRTKHSHLLQEGRDYFTLTKRKEVADLQAAYPENPWVPYAGTKVTLWTETGAKTLAALLRNNHAVYTCSLLSKNYFNAVPVKAPKPKPVHFINEHIDTMLKQCTSSKSGVSYTGYLLEEWKRADTILQKYAMIEACSSARDICGLIMSAR